MICFLFGILVGLVCGYILGFVVDILDKKEKLSGR